MATIHCSASLDVDPDVAWDFLDRYTRGEVHIFSACAAERGEGDVRVVTLHDGTEVRERNVTVDPERRRAVYTVPELMPGAEHHQAEMRVDVAADGVATLVWCTDVLPDSLAEVLRTAYPAMFEELLAAVRAHRLP